jgi:hypothetical protein
LSQKWWWWSTIGGVKSCYFEVDFWAANDDAFQHDFLPYFWEWKSRCKSREEIWDLRNLQFINWYRYGLWIKTFFLELYIIRLIVLLKICIFATGYRQLLKKA